MKQVILLTRHGETYGNAHYYRKKTYDGVPPFLFDDLTETGRKQARRLGETLKTFLGEHRPFFITSELERSIETAGIIAQEVDCFFNDVHLASEHLNERKPLEWYPPEEQEQKRATTPTSEELANLAALELIHLGNHVTRPVLVAVLHGVINTVMLQSLDITVPTSYHYDHCGIYVLGHDDKTLRVLDHTYYAHDDLDRLITTCTIEKLLTY